MSDLGLRYDRMVENALRGVVREALQEVVSEGLPGEHHFYITFLTNHPEVEIAERLKSRYPDEMTIVLQHRFWDLQVFDHHFEVTLTFGDIAERLSIPFSALTGFADPSVRFGLQFGDLRLPEGEEETEGDASAETAEEDKEAEAAEPPVDDGEKVVTLDRFRKKT
jgi:hypothetical protein